MKKIKIPSKPKKFDAAGWDLTFEDNFETLDRTKWKVNNIPNGLRRVAYYTDDCVFIRDGKLVLRAEFKNGVWHSGWVETSTKNKTGDYSGFSQREGYFECRCKAPRALGIWSAFWLMPDEGAAFTAEDIQGTGKDGAEIDIMESPFSYKFNPNITQHAVHCDGYDERLKSAASPILKVDSIYDDFHTYAVEWNSEEYVFYVDGYETWRTNHLNGTSQVREYIILSVEVAGFERNGNLFAGKEAKGKKAVKAWQGNPMKNDLTKRYDFEIDYVRVYNKKYM